MAECVIIKVKSGSQLLGCESHSEEMTRMNRFLSQCKCFIKRTYSHSVFALDHLSMTFGSSVQVGVKTASVGRTFDSLILIGHTKS